MNGFSTSYRLASYEVALADEAELTERVNDVSVPELDRDMGRIDWQTAFAMVGAGSPDGEGEDAVEAVVLRLLALEESEAGKEVARALKQKHWWGTSPPPATGRVTLFKRTFALGQRFYVQDGQPLISIAEACRFLQYKKWERTLQAARKKPSALPAAEERPAGTTRSPHRKKEKQKRIDKTD